MAAEYPAAIKTFSAVVNGVTKLVQALFNSPYEEITATQTELGTDVAGSAADLKTRLAVSMNADGTLLGAWVDKSASYAAQQATTDGFVCVIVNSSGTDANVQGYSDANANPTTIRGRCFTAHNYTSSFMFPVKKSDYWKVIVTAGGIDAVYWIPL